MIQLAWSVSGTIAPVAFAWLLDRGETSCGWPCSR